jgi:hypothetical protein
MRSPPADATVNCCALDVGCVDGSARAWLLRHFSVGLANRRRVQKEDMRLYRGGLYALRSIAKSAMFHSGREEVVLRCVLRWLHGPVRHPRRALVLA